ncbi:MAG: DUF2079 domain-containing protein [Firmicutes bacterium]|nr:DUF2079 domain-containing protein [Alicyclobacillaceae bacterium]MCL6497434.1 DUF2079 domain-containing protein [Bacillota bacterium]
MEATATYHPEETYSVGPLLKLERLSTWVWVLGYTAVLTTLSVVRYEWFAAGWDLGYYEQAMWALYHQGPGALATLSGYPVLADSASFILLILAPFFVWFGVGFLFVLQSLALGLGYWWIRRIGNALGLDPVRARLVGIVYLLYPVIIAANLFDFHPDVLAVPLLFAAMSYSLQNRWGAYALTIFACLLVKDMAALAVLGLGLTLLCQRKWGAGAITFLAGSAWLVATTSWFIPWLAHHPMSQWVAYYGQWGKTPLSGLRYLARHPEALFGWIRQVRAWEYLVWIFGPLVGLLFLGMRPTWVSVAWLIPAAVILEANLLSRFPAQTSPFDQYSLFAVPSLMLAMLQMGRPRMRAGNRWKWGAVVPAAGFFIVLAYHLHATTWRAHPSNVASLEAAVLRVPNGAPVVAQNFVLPHVARRAVLYDLNQGSPVYQRPGTYILVDPRFSTTGVQGQRYANAVAKNLAKQGYQAIFHDGGVILFRSRGR